QGHGPAGLITAGPGPPPGPGGSGPTGRTRPPPVRSASATTSISSTGSATRTRSSGSGHRAGHRPVAGAERRLAARILTADLPPRLDRIGSRVPGLGTFEVDDRRGPAVFGGDHVVQVEVAVGQPRRDHRETRRATSVTRRNSAAGRSGGNEPAARARPADRKSTRLNSRH